MPVYTWQAVDRKGNKQKGEIETDNATIARQLLLRKGLNVKRVKAKPKDIAEYVPMLRPKVKERDMVIFVRQFATMIDAGLPIIQCLEILHEQQSNLTFKKIIKQIKRDIEEGATFSDAIGKHPKVFDRLFVNLVAAGEMSGILDVILNRLAVYIEKIAGLKRKIRGAMTYPAIVVGVAMVVIAVILVYVIPVFAGLFKDAGVSLPAMTIFVMTVSDYARRYFHWLIVGFILLVMAIRRTRGTSRGRTWTDRILLKLPVFGILLRKVAISRFTRTLSTMLESGVPILDSLDIVAAATGNKVVENAIRQARTAIAEGHPVAAPLIETRIFPTMVTQMIAVGEATGALGSMLGKIADFYDEEVDATVADLTSMLEPLLIVFLGVTVGGLLVAMYLPIFQLADVVARGS